MDKARRRAAKTAWRKRDPQWAVVAVRIGARTWVKLTPDPAALENRVRFMLKTGGAGLAPGMAAAWTGALHAGGTAAFETLEELAADLSDLARERVGADRLERWAKTLDATVF